MRNKQILLFAIISFCFINCQRSTENSINYEKKYLPDTFRYTYKEKHYELFSVNKEKYRNSKLINLTTDLKDLVSYDTNKISIQVGKFYYDSLIKLPLESEDTLVFKTDTMENDIIKDFKFIGSVKNEDFWLINENWSKLDDSWCADHSFFIMINKKNGKITEMQSYPIFSPNHRYIICADNNTETCCNVIQVFEVLDNRDIVIKLEATPEKWLPVAIQWITNNEILIEIQKGDFINQEVLKPKDIQYIKLKV